MNRWIVLLAQVLVGCGASIGPPVGPYERPRSALLILDLQKDFLQAGGRMPVAAQQVDPMINLVQALARQAHVNGASVIMVRNTFPRNDLLGNFFRNQAAVEATDGAETDERIHIEANASFTKAAPDAFSNQDLDAYLREQQVETLVVAGVFADQCVQTTVMAALNRKYQVHVVQDATAAKDDQTREQAMQAMAQRGATILQAAEDVAW